MARSHAGRAIGAEVGRACHFLRRAGESDALAADEIAKMAEMTAEHAERAAHTARQAAGRAAAFAADSRAGRLAEADKAVADTNSEEDAARARYHDGEATVRQRHGANGAPR